jgi:hypothetical protein
VLSLLISSSRRLLFAPEEDKRPQSRGAFPRPSLPASEAPWPSKPRYPPLRDRAHPQDPLLALWKPQSRRNELKNIEFLFV